MPLIAGSQDYIHGGTQKNEYKSEEVIDVPCPSCGSEERKRIYTEHGAVGISKCLACALVYTSPRIQSPEQIYWGDGDVYYEEARLIFEGSTPHHRDPNYLQEIKTIERHKSKGRFLDVGCNYGMLLRIARQRGWQAVGVEPSPSLSKLATKHGFQVYNCFLNELPETELAAFDVIALSDVFEHITEPIALLETAGRYLKSDGVLYVKVPNVKWSFFKQGALGLMGRHPSQGLWDAYEHVVHYSDVTLKAMLDKGGFRTVSMSLDPPVQTPNWHEYVGHYYQYPSPFLLDWKRKTVRSTCYHAARLERLVRFGSIGYLAPNIVAVARKK
jgi:SAM-dependent methyltransferase